MFPETGGADPLLGRRIELEGAFNFRDLGGYPTTSGGKVPEGLLYRSDDLFRLSESDLAVMETLGIKTVIDLRTEIEAQIRGRFPVDKLPLDYVRKSLIDISADYTSASGNGANDFIFHRYVQILTQGSEAIRQVLERLFDPQSLPAVFHCAIGKDRTGLVAALALETMGVERSYVALDYALTERSIDAMLAWLDTVIPRVAKALRQLPPVVMSAKAENMERVLAWMDENYGGVPGYLAQIGVPQDALQRFRSLAD